MSADTLFGVVAIMALSLGSAASQEQGATKVHHVTVQVSGDQDHTIPHTITIELIRSGPPRDHDVLKSLDWVATRVSERGTNHLSSAECPVLQELALAFRELPPIQSNTWATYTSADPEPFLPTMKDGFRTSVTFQSGAMRTSAEGGQYQVWGHEVVSKLLGCWEPLIPEGSSRYWERLTP